MSGQYKVAWLCEALLVSRSGYYDWKERRRTTRTATAREHASARNAFGRSLPAVVRPMAARGWLSAGLSGTAQSHCPAHACRAALCPAAFQVSRGHDRQSSRRTDRAQPISRSHRANGPIKSGSPTPPASSPAKAGCIWSRSWMSSRAVSSAGPCTKSSMPAGHRRPAHGLDQRQPGDPHRPLRSRRPVRQRRLPPGPHAAPL